MKSLVLIAALASSAAHAGNVKLMSKDGTTAVTPIAGTARSYTNAKGVKQVDMLFDSSSEVVLLGKKIHSDDRKRMAFTGCSNKTGVMFEVDSEGKPRLPDSLHNDEWVSGGSAMMDKMAAIACKAAPPLTIAAPPLANAASTPMSAAVPIRMLAAPTPMSATGLAAPEGIPNLSGYEGETRQAMELACVSEKVTGPVAYRACLNEQIASLKGSSGIPNLRGYDRETRQAMELACVSEKVRGPVAYGGCLDGQIASLRGFSGIPNLSGYDRETRQAMELACVSEKVRGPVAYGGCLNEQIASLMGSSGIPNLSGYDRETRQALELACVSEKVRGPVAYGACLRRHVESLDLPRAR
jgi:hypothetical protein